MNKIIFIAVMGSFFGLTLFGQETEVQAEKLYSEARYQKAASAYEKLITKEGRKLTLLLGLGKSLFGLKETRRSQALFQEVIGEDDSIGAAHYWMGRVLSQQALDGIEAGRLLASADLRDAVSFYRAASSREKDPFRSHFAAGRALMYLLDFDGAIKELQEARRLRPKNRDVMIHLLGAFYRGERFQEFLQVGRQEKIPMDPMRELDAILRLGRVEETKKLLFALIEKHGYAGRKEPYNVLLKVAEDSKKLPAIIEILQALRAKVPGEHFVSFYLGYVQGLAGDYGGAEKNLKAHLKIMESSWMARVYLASALRLGGKLEAADQEIRLALAQVPDASLAQEGASMVVGAWVNKKEFERALSLHSLLLKGQASAATRRNHAILLKETGRIKEAIAILQELCDEEDVEGFRLSKFWNDLGLCLKGDGQREKAKAALLKATEIFEFNGDAWENLGVIEFENKDFNAAQNSLKTAIRVRLAEDSQNKKNNWRARYYLKLVKSARIGVSKGHS